MEPHLSYSTDVENSSYFPQQTLYHVFACIDWLLEQNTCDKSSLNFEQPAWEGGIVKGEGRKGESKLEGGRGEGNAKRQEEGRGGGFCKES